MPLALSDYFASYLPDVKGLSDNTIISYQYAFQLLFEFMDEKKGLPPEKITFKSLMNDTIAEFLSWLEVERGCSPSTRNQRRAAIVSFASYAAKKNLVQSLPFYTEVSRIPKKKTSKSSDIKYFTKEEMGILLNSPNSSTALGKRDIVLLSALYATGARAGEICDLKVGDISFGKVTNVKLSGQKSKSPRWVTIPNNCAEILKQYLTFRNLDTKNTNDKLRYVFHSQNNAKMSISCVEEIVKKYVAKVKSANPSLFKRNRYSPHSIRHSIAVHMLECGESLVVIKAFLGHASITSTVQYASVTPELANKYLRERGEPLNAANLGNKINSVNTLPFLQKYYHRKNSSVIQDGFH